LLKLEAGYAAFAVLTAAVAFASASSALVTADAIDASLDNTQLLVPAASATYNLFSSL
jgi:hypothetical protein